MSTNQQVDTNNNDTITMKRMSLSNSMEIQLLETEARLWECVDEWLQCDWVAIDTEFMRVKTYYPKLCLIQVHSKFGTVAIDALSIQRLNALSTLFESRTIHLILHACLQDLQALIRREHFVFNALFDTQTAAAFCGYSESIGYARLVDDLCGIKLAKDQTRTDWAKRPLTSKQLEYAKNDVVYLNQIHKTFKASMEKSAKIEWFQEECAHIGKRENLLAKPQDAWLRFHDLDVPDRAKGIARELVVWREHCAQQRDCPRRWIMSNQALIELCIARPQTRHQLWRIKSLNKYVVKKFGDAILAIIRKNKKTSTDQANAAAKSSCSAFKKDVKSAMNILRAASDQHGISQGLLGSRKDIEMLILGAGPSKLMKGWRYEVIGHTLKQQFS